MPPSIFSTKNIIIIFLILLLIVWLTSCFIIYSEFSNRSLVVNYFDIGQGDAIYIKTPNNYKIVIDGGPDNTLVYKLGQYLPFYDRDIDLLILSHPDGDHMIGFVELLRRYKVKYVLLTGISNYSPAYDSMLTEIVERGVKILYTGETSIINIEPGIYFEVLFPKEILIGREVPDKNYTSIVIKLTYGEVSFLFTGDSPIEVEQKMIKDNLDLTSDILKLGHHGSKTSTGPEFLQAVDPALAIIPVGQNSFGHPSPEVIANLNRHEIPYLTTLDFSDIIITSNGREYEVLLP